MYTTNLIESLNTTTKRKIKSKGSFPIEVSTLKIMHLATQEQQEQQEKWNRIRLRNSFAPLG